MNDHTRNLEKRKLLVDEIPDIDLKPDEKNENDHRTPSLSQLVKNTCPSTGVTYATKYKISEKDSDQVYHTKENIKYSNISPNLNGLNTTAGTNEKPSDNKTSFLVENIKTQLKSNLFGAKKDNAANAETVNKNLDMDFMKYQSDNALEHPSKENVEFRNENEIKKEKNTYSFLMNENLRKIESLSEIEDISKKNSDYAAYTNTNESASNAFAPNNESVDLNRNFKSFLEISLLNQTNQSQQSNNSILNNAFIMSKSRLDSFFSSLESKNNQNNVTLDTTRSILNYQTFNSEKNDGFKVPYPVKINNNCNNNNNLSDKLFGSSQTKSWDDLSITSNVANEFYLFMNNYDSFINDSCIKELAMKNNWNPELYDGKIKTKPSQVDQIKESYKLYNKKIEERRNKKAEKILQETQVIKESLEEIGYMVDDKNFKNSKYKIKKVSLFRQPTNKEFKSAKASDNFFSTLNTVDKQVKEMPVSNLSVNKNSSFVKKHFTNKQNDYRIMKKRYSNSVKRVFDSVITLTDSGNGCFKKDFKIFTDEDIGITPHVQFEMTEAVSLIY